MSSTRQWSVQDWWVSRNPSVDANGTTLNPAERSNRETDFRTDGSSSMTPITGVADCFVSTIPVPCESPCSPARRAGETHAHYRPGTGVWNMTLGQLPPPPSDGGGQRRLQDAQPVRHPDQLGHGAGFHFSHDACAVDLDRALARPQAPGDLLVEHARHHQPEHLPLAGRESVHPRRQSAHEALERLSDRGVIVHHVHRASSRRYGVRVARNACHRHGSRTGADRPNGASHGHVSSFPGATGSAKWKVAPTSELFVAQMRPW